MGYVIKQTKKQDPLKHYGRIKSIVKTIDKSGDFLKIAFKVGTEEASDLFPLDSPRLKRLYFRSGAANATPEGEDWNTDRILNRSVEAVWGYVEKDGTKYPRLVSFKETDEDTPERWETLEPEDWEIYGCDATGMWRKPER